MLTPPPSRLLGTVMGWFAAAGVTPTRLSMCNNIPVTVQTIESGLAIAVLPLGAVQAELPRKRLRALSVAPMLPAHEMLMCHRSSARGPGIDAVVQLMKELIRAHRLFS